MNEPSRVKWGNTSAVSSGGGDAITRLTVPTGVTVKSLEVCPSVAEYTIRLPSGDQRGFGSSVEPSVTGVSAVTPDPSNCNIMIAEIAKASVRRTAAIVPRGTTLT